MCGRFSLSKKTAELEKRFNAKANVGVDTPLFNIAPTHKVPVVTQTEPGSIQSFQWGFQPTSNSGVSVSSTVINARSETVLSKGLFKRLISRNRCLMLADAYIEWKSIGGTKVPYLVRFADYRPFAFAGIFDEFENMEGETMKQVCMLTREAQVDLQGLHERMPVILNEQTEKNWLQQLPDQDGILAMTSRTLEGLMQYPINQKINKDFSNSAQLIDRQVYHIPVQGNLFG